MEFPTKESSTEEHEEEIRPSNRPGTEGETPFKVGVCNPSGEPSTPNDDDPQNERNAIRRLVEQNGSQHMQQGLDEILTHLHSVEKSANGSLRVHQVRLTLGSARSVGVI